MVCDNKELKRDQNDSLFLLCFFCLNWTHFFVSGSFHRQECSELFVGKTGIWDPHAELGGSHGGPDPSQRDHRQQCESAESELFQARVLHGVWYFTIKNICSDRAAQWIMFFDHCYGQV